MKAHPYLIENDSTGSQFEPIDSRARHYDEAWLQELLRLHPNILPSADIEPVYSPLIPIGREVGTTAGSIDNLFISKQGYLVMVETKLWRNPEGRREVLAQAIDYGVAISRWSYENLDQVVRNYTKYYEEMEYDLISWVELNFGPIEAGLEDFKEIVGRSMRLGRFLTLIVGNRIRHSLQDLLSGINRYPHLAMEIALVELACYRWKKDRDWPLVVVPNLVLRTETVERSVVQVTLVPTGGYQVDAVQEKASSPGTGRTRKFLTEDDYWNFYKKRSPDSYQIAHNLIEKYRQMEGITVDTTEVSIVVRLDIQDSGEKATLFFIENFGILASWPGTIRQQVERAGFSRNLVDEYEAVMSKILKLTGKWKLAKGVNKVDIQALNAAVDNFIQVVQSAEPVSE